MARKSGSISTTDSDQTKSRSRHNDKSYYQIQSVSSALSLLEHVAGSSSGLTVDQLRKELRIAKDAVLRLIATLEQRHYLELDPLSNHYRLSIQTLELSQSFIRHSTLFRHAKPFIEELSRACGESVYIAIFKDKQTVYLQHAETQHAVRVVSRFGAQLPGYCSAGGKVLLAGMTAEKLTAYLESTELIAYTQATITEPLALQQHLLQVAAQGYAINEEELETGVSGVAAPVRNHTGQVIAAVVISAPTVRVTPTRLHNELVPLVRETADNISTRLGYSLTSREKG